MSGSAVHTVGQLVICVSVDLASVSRVEPHACSVLGWGLQPLLDSAPSQGLRFQMKLHLHTASAASLHLTVWVLLGSTCSPWKQDGRGGGVVTYG